MNKKLKRAIIASALFFLIFLSVILIVKEDFLYRTFTDNLIIMISTAAFIASLFTFKELGFASKEGKVWFFLMLGCFVSAVAEIIWTYYEILLRVNPYPSLADIGYLSCYIFFIISFLMEYLIIKESLQKNIAVFPVLATILLGAVMVYFVLIPIAVDPDYDLLSKIVGYSYLVGDMLLVFLSLLIFFSFRGAKISSSWLMIATALMLWGITDMVFTYVDWVGLYEGTYLVLTDIGYISSYIFLAFGAYYHRLVLGGEV
jgi:hypothetical protein